MKIRTEIEFQDYMDSELSWRKKEISEIMAFLKFSQLSESTILRISIPIFYAHFEGFQRNHSPHMQILRWKFPFSHIFPSHLPNS